MNYKEQLTKYNQTTLLKKELSDDIVQELSSIDWNSLSQQLIAIDKTNTDRSFTPLKINSSSLPADHPHPIFTNKKIGCLVMAGGLATRLGSTHPKGVLPISVLEGKSLFQMICEKVIAFSECYDAPASLAVMTSKNNDAETKEHFIAHNFFGLGPERVDFFIQSELPFLDIKKQLCINSQSQLMQGPDGNGSLFSAFSSSGIAEKWAKKDIEALSIIQIDNPLLDPFHPHLFEPIFQGYDIAAAAIERVDPNERVGVFVQENGSLAVAEYSEISTSEYGANRFPWANISFFTCSLSFARQAATHSLPLHVAKKEVQGRWIWKGEYFIFDHLKYAKKACVVPIDRELYFSPIKNKSGPDSIKTAQQALLQKDQKKCEQLNITLTQEVPQKIYYPKK